MMLFSRSDSRVTICSSWRCSSLKSGMPESMLTEPAIEVKGLRISCAMAAASRPTAASRSCMRDFALQAPDFGQIIEGVDESQRAPRPEPSARKPARGRSCGSHWAQPIALRREPRSRINVRQRIEKELVDRLTQQVLFRALQQFLRGGVDQSDVSVEAGGDQSASDGLNDVFVQGLQIFQRAAGVLQLYVHLAQLVGQQPGQIGDRQDSRTG